MSSNEDLLLSKIMKAAKDQKKQAGRHKNLYRCLWLASALVSVSIAVFSTFDLCIYGIPPKNVSTFLSIILPFITGYVVLRSPDQLWVFEVSTRNQLNDLAAEMELLIDRKVDFDRAPYEKKYLSIMAKANKRWVMLKQNSG